jgi:hypothetical protein
LPRLRWISWRSRHRSIDGGALTNEMKAKGRWPRHHRRQGTARATLRPRRPDVPIRHPVAEQPAVLPVRLDDGGGSATARIASARLPDTAADDSVDSASFRISRASTSVDLPRTTARCLSRWLRSSSMRSPRGGQSTRAVGSDVSTGACRALCPPYACFKAAGDKSVSRAGAITKASIARGRPCVPGCQ